MKYVPGWCDHFEGALPGYDDWKTSIPRDEEDAHSDPPVPEAGECQHGVWWPEYCHECWREDQDAFQR